MRVKEAFRSPQLFRPDSEKNLGSCRITLHTPPAFPASSTPEILAARPVWGKKGAFPPANPAETRLFARRPPFFPPERPAVRPGTRPFSARRAPGTRRPRKTRRPGSRPRVRDFPPEARQLSPPKPRPRPPARRFPPETPPKPARQAPPEAPLRSRPSPAPPVRRPNAPAKAHPLVGQPRLPWSAFPLRRGEVCAPRGDQIPGHDG